MQAISASGRAARTIAHTLAALGAALALAAGGAAWAIPPTSTLTAEVGGQRIAIYLYLPQGHGPFPLVVASHGSPRLRRDFDSMGQYTLRAVAETFVAEGVAVAVPIRRGYGGQGRWVESHGDCAAPDYYGAAMAGADDIDAAIAVLRADPRIDPTRVVLLGHSAGAWASLAAATRGGVLGVVSFAGGRGSTAPDTVCHEENLVSAAARFGERTHVPELWIYSVNDHFFGPALEARMQQAFQGAGGQVTFWAAPAWGDDGHQFIDDLDDWRPVVNRYLRRVGFLR